RAVARRGGHGAESGGGDRPAAGRRRLRRDPDRPCRFRLSPDRRRVTARRRHAERHLGPAAPGRPRGDAVGGAPIVRIVSVVGARPNFVKIGPLIREMRQHAVITPAVGARRNLIREGIAPRKIHFVGNVMADALLASRPRWRTSSIVDRLGLAGTPFAVLTLHRPANVDDPRVFGDLLGALREIGRHIPIVFPVHPRVTSRLASEATAPGSGRGLICRPPLGYLDFVALMSRARLVLTDSGGIQEETTMLGVPCLTLRDTTERPVTVTHGTNRA